MSYRHSVGAQTWIFRDLKDLMARASPPRSGDTLAGVAATSHGERMAARMRLAELPLTTFLNECVIPYESDEVTRLIVDTHDAQAFAPLAHLTVGEFRNWLLSEASDSGTLARVRSGVTPEMAAAVSKLMRNQDLVIAASKCRVVTRFRNSIGLPGTMAVRLQPNHPTDSAAGIAASILDGLLYGAGDAVIGINPVSDNLPVLIDLLKLVDEVITRFSVPTQSCVLTHVTHTIEAIEKGAPVDLVFQSIAGTEKANSSFGVSLALLAEARAAAQSLARG
ncbi:MAG TPA: ethanolamine ammonia-lyase subunit EutB, partial [Burkholderiaceae bacterium]|nr:ethanolamine ammonia-lyase subunit EutB [Burkholderiaceae bacterium]